MLFLEFCMLLHHLANTLIALVSSHCSCDQALLVLPLDLTGRLEPHEVIDHRVKVDTRLLQHCLQLLPILLAHLIGWSGLQLHGSKLDLVNGLELCGISLLKEC